MLIKSVVAAVALLAAISGCSGASSDTSTLKCVVDGVSGDRAAEIVTGVHDWETATDGAFRCAITYQAGAEHEPGTIVFRDAGLRPNLYGETHTFGKGDTVDAFILMSASVSGDTLARVVRHELGHALNLRYEGSADTSHYAGSEPSAMRPYDVWQADEVEPVDVAAFRAKWQ